MPSSDEIAAMARVSDTEPAPGAYAALERTNMGIDVRDIPSAANVPTLVLHYGRHDTAIRRCHGYRGRRCARRWNRAYR
jgi:hypothetical protein